MLVAAAVVGLGAGAVLAFDPSTRRSVAAALYLPDLSPAMTVRPLTFLTPRPKRVEVRFGPTERGWTGWLSLPDRPGPHPGLVVSLGVAPAGPHDPRVVELADGLARIGVAALVPYSPNLVAGRIEPEDVAFEVAAFRYLTGRPDVDPERVGMLGICVGASLSMIAAADPEVSDEVAVVAWFGGYHDMDTLIASVVSRSAMRDGAITPWTPDPLAQRVVAKGIDSLLQRTSETSEAERARIADSIRALRDRPTYDQALAILASLPPSARARIDALSPSEHLGGVTAPVYLMVGVDDRLVPSDETTAAAEVLGDRVVRHDRFQIFTHVDLDRLDGVRSTASELARLHQGVLGVLTAIGATE